MPHRFTTREALVAGCLFAGLSAFAGDDPASPGDQPRRGDKVVVTGSRLRAAERQSAQEVRVYERERIERSGQSTLADFLATVPEVSLNSQESTFLGTSVRLRGAREGSALILVNGRRTQPVTGDAASFGFFDLNTIPLGMVERIEILPNGSSAIYGGEALAGVVNIVLRRGFSGTEVTFAYKGARNTDEKGVTAAAGWKSDDASLSLMGSYTERSSLQGRDRAITSSLDYRSLGGPNLGSQFLGAPANVSSVSGNLPGLNASFATVPAGSTGIGLRPSDFAATAGTQNTGSFTAYQSLIPDLHRGGLFVDASYHLRGFDLFAEILATKYKLYLENTPPILQLTTVPATNAFNPFGTAVRLSGVVRGAEDLARRTFSEEFWRPLVGARGSAGAWDWEASAMFSRDRGSTVTYGAPVATRLAAALASSDPRSALNPFIDGAMASRELLESIYSGSTVTDYKVDDTLVNAFARGPLARLPAGPLDMVAGTEFEKNRLERGFTSDRDVSAAFAELRAPLLAGDGERGARRELLAMQAAARYDHYSDFGAKSTWQAGVEYRPATSVLLRGTHGTAFKPPTLFNIGAPLTTGSASFVDPLRNRETVIAQNVQGGNPALQPTTGDSSTIGVVWSPSQWPALNMALTGWRLRIENAINLPNGQFIVDNESLYPGRVTRESSSSGAPGRILAVNGTYVNFGTLREEGIDASAEWRVGTRIGELTPAFAATYMTKFSGASTPGGPDVDRLSRANADGIFAPRVKATASLGWKPQTAYSAWLAGRYIGRYYDYTPPRTIGDVWYLDASLDIAVEPAFGLRKGALAGLRLILSATNLTDKLPPYSTHFRGYDIYNYDLVGRTFLVRLRIQT